MITRSFRFCHPETGFQRRRGQTELGDRCGPKSIHADQKCLPVAVERQQKNTRRTRGISALERTLLAGSLGVSLPGAHFAGFESFESF
jgi:hypothetical protein